MAMLLAGVVIFAIRGFGLVEHNIYTSYAVLMTAALESILFSFALADRIKRLQQTHMSLLEKEKKLSKITITDDLTGLFNRRHFNNILMHSIQYARQSGQKMAMLLIDIDFFKSVNDTYGHQKGDEVLRVLGDIIKEALRKSDFPCRIGGEEFAVLTPGTNISEALVVGERIRKEFASRPFKSFSDKTFFPP
jgi:diguanylate cyclase (GGDEF)-like protein